MTKKSSVAERRANRIANAPGMDTPLSEVIAYVEEGIMDGGVPCPACGQECHCRRRTLSSTLARALLALLQFPDRYMRFKLIVSGPDKEGGDKIKLKHWGFIEEMPRTMVGPDGKWHQGFYRITETGIAFAQGLTRVSAAYYGYNNRVVDWVETTVDIHGALGADFNLGDVLNSLIADEEVGEFILISDLRPAAPEKVPAGVSPVA